MSECIQTKNLVIVTGASRGIGREIARQIAHFSGFPSYFMLLARNEAALEEVRDEVRKECVYGVVDVFVCDMTKFGAQEFEERLLRITGGAKLPEFGEKEQIKTGICGQNKQGPFRSSALAFDNLYLFHNVGSVGDVTKKATELDSKQDWSTYMDVNLISMIQLNNIVLKHITKEIATNRFVVNITSLLAIQAFPSLTQYAVGKAAREAFFRALTAEEKDIKVLQYSPGPVDTDMHTEIATSSFDEGIRGAFASEEESEVNKKKLTTEVTVKKLMNILRENTFEHGARIDYFDA